jgi:hypothetical protein
MFRESPRYRLSARCILRCVHSRKRQLFVDLDMRLFEAVKQDGKLDEARQLIEDGAHVNYADMNGWASLLDASYRDDLWVAVVVAVAMAGCRRVADHHVSSLSRRDRD